MRTSSGLSAGLLAGTLGALVCAAAPALAEAGAWQLDAGAGYRAFSADAQGTGHALVGRASLHRWLDEAWQVGVGVELGGLVARAGGSALAGDGGPFSRGELTVRWALDAFTWVPFVEVGAGLLLRDRVEVDEDVVATETTLAPTVSASLGVDWRPARDWSLGARVGGAFLPGREGARGTGGMDSDWLGRADLCASWHFED
jgi:hypothetical protein